MCGKCTFRIMVCVRQEINPDTTEAKSQSVLAGIAPIPHLGEFLSVQGRGCSSSVPCLEVSKAVVSLQIINCCLQSEKLRAPVPVVLSGRQSRLTFGMYVLVSSWTFGRTISSGLHFPDVDPELLLILHHQGRQDRKKTDRQHHPMKCGIMSQQLCPNCFLPRPQEVLFSVCLIACLFGFW